MAILVIGEKCAQYVDALHALKDDLDVRLWPDVGSIDDIRYTLAWSPAPGELAKLPRLELIVSVGAGIDGLLADPDLPTVPLVRFVDPDLTKRMSDYILLHCLFHHRRMVELLAAGRRAEWVYRPEPLSSELRVGIMGLGELGSAAAAALLNIGYQVNGWSRSAKTIEGVSSFAGDDSRQEFLAQTDILVALLPLTPATKGIIDRDLLGALAQDSKLPGPVLINAGRGGLQVESDILSALETGMLYAATLDVFNEEPLPGSSPLWAHDHVIVTPHNASESAANAIAAYTLRQISAYETGQPLANLVDRARGY